MTYLLDVNALIALALIDHMLHPRVALWVRKTQPDLATCSITELGFVRVLSQASAYGFAVAQARDLLLRLKKTESISLSFLPDEHDISQLPGWVRSPKQITDGHLSKLASAHSAILATLDEGIAGSFLIPK